MFKKQNIQVQKQFKCIPRQNKNIYQIRYHECSNKNAAFKDILKILTELILKAKDDNKNATFITSFFTFLYFSKNATKKKIKTFAVLGKLLALPCAETNEIGIKD